MPAYDVDGIALIFRIFNVASRQRSIGGRRTRRDSVRVHYTTNRLSVLSKKSADEEHAVQKDKEVWAI